MYHFHWNIMTNGLFQLQNNAHSKKKRWKNDGFVADRNLKIWLWMIDCLEVEIVFDVVLTSCYVWIEFHKTIIYTLQNVFCVLQP